MNGCLQSYAFVHSLLACARVPSRIVATYIQLTNAATSSPFVAALHTAFTLPD